MAKRQSSFIVPSSEVSRNLDNSTYDNVKVVSDNIQAVVTTSENIGDIQTLATDLIAVNTVSTSIANINIVAPSITDVNTTATSIASVNTVATNIDNVNATGPNIANVNLTAGSIASVNTTATNIADVNIVATNISDVTNYADTWYGPKATEPTSRNDGSPMLVGDSYFDTTTNYTRRFDGTKWSDAFSGDFYTQQATDNLLAAKAPLLNPVFTGTVSGVTKAMVGLESVDNTSDVNKPVSTAQQTALNLKAPIVSPALTGTPTAPTAPAGTNNTQIATTAFVNTNSIPTATIIIQPINNIPSGFLECNGAALSRTAYADLFAVIGTTYGAGDGSTTFSIPDSRGEFIRGLDNGRGIDLNRNIASAQGDAIRNMTGTIKMSNPNQGGTGVFSNTSTAGADANSWGGGSCATVIFDASTVVPTANEARPRNIAMMYCIKY